MSASSFTSVTTIHHIRYTRQHTTKDPMSSTKPVTTKAKSMSSVAAKTQSIDANDDDDAADDEKPLCKYGAKCYRRHPGL